MGNGHWRKRFRMSQRDGDALFTWFVIAGLALLLARCIGR